jgi:hypothetical protein
METFIKSLRPCILSPVCIKKVHSEAALDHISDLCKLMVKNQVGLEMLRKEFC